ncbi:MAG: hypothetical protein ACE5J3_06690, partial [Methanosarcinales archaeon]
KQAINWYGHYKIINAKSFKIKSNYPPFIGVCPDAPEELVTFLREEGFYVDESTSKDKFKIYLDIDNFNEEYKLSILQEIEKSDVPLIRIWRWPYCARSALSITGDIDAMTIWDYVRRFMGYEDGRFI